MVEKMNGDLFPETIPQPEEHSTGTGRFFPCNREDAILLLGGLCISAGFPEGRLRLAVSAGRPARLSDGLRAEEETLLNGGNAACFPILLELGGETGHGAGTIRFPEIRRLVFRTQADADAFLFRPFDEFDPGDMPHDVRPDRFGLPGPARFTLREDGPDAHARIADRVAAGIHYVLQLAETWPSCMQAAATFLGGGNDSMDMPSAGSLIASAFGDRTHGCGRAGHVITASFLRMDVPSPAEMLDCLDEEFAMHESEDPETRAKEERWLAVMREVVANTRMLGKDLLGDEGAVLYRGALLATMTESPGAIGAFLSRDNLAGPHVCCMAAFLTGLKTGVMNMPWRLKSRQAGRLSGILDSLLASPSGTVLETGTGRHGDRQYTTVRCGHTILLSLETETRAESHRADPEHENSPGDGQDVPPDTRQWLDLEDFRVEVRMNGSAGFTFPTLVWHIPANRSLVRQAAIRAFHEHGGKLWYLRQDGDERWLGCDLPGLPAPGHLPLLAAGLAQAISECLKPEKAGKTARKKGKKTAEAAS